MAFPVSPNIGDTHTEDDTLWTYGSNGWYSTIIGDANDTRYTCGPSLGSLNDVDLTPPPNDGDALVYDSATDSWIPGAAGATPGGLNTQIQFNDGGTALGGDADLTWNKTTNVMTVAGDVNLNDGGTFTTTLQTVTPTANRTISFPNATGTVGLVAGSSGQLLYNASGANAGVPSSVVGATGDVTLALNGAASTPPLDVTGTWFTGGTSTTTKPQVLIEPAGATSTAWSTSGTGLGVNAASGFVGNLLDLQVNGSPKTRVRSDGSLIIGDNLTSASSSGQLYLFKHPSSSNDSGFTGLESYVRLFIQGAQRFQFGTGGFNVRGDTFIGWSASSSDVGGIIDLFLSRDAADTLAQRRTTNAQTFRCYGTYTDASNYVRAALSSTSTAVTLAAETAGTGADDIPLNLTAAGTGTIKVNSVAEVVVSSTVAGLPATPVVGMLTRVTDATAPAVGSTVTGGGAAAALCWYNGANWSVIGV